MVTIYAPNAQDFSTLGLGALAPYECTVEEQAGGMYELSMTHPMDEAGKWLNIGVGCIVKAPAPVRETPLADEDADGEIPTEPVTVTRKIYKVQTNTGANLHLRQGPSTSTKILSKYRPGTEVVVLSQANGWGQVIVRASGAAGYMSMQYLVYVRDETETIAGDAPSPERVVYPVQSRMQLFRIYKVERDAAEREVRVEARHIFYDLLGDPTKNEYAPEGAAADTVVEELFERALNAHGFTVHSQLTGTVTGEYTRRGLVECLLDPDDGVLPQTNGRLIRDNFDIWLLPDLPRETGVTIRHGKNLLGATLTTDWDSLVTRIIPVGQDKEGKPLLLEGATYIDSPRIGDYPVIRAQAVEYDVKVGQEGINNAAQARAKLTELAEADFSDNGVDLPTVGLDVDFVALGETEEYKKYADLEAVHLYDTVRVVAREAGIDAAVRVTGYKWDALGRRYESVTLGELTEVKTSVYGYQLADKSVGTVKLQNGAVGSAQLRELAVQYAHINTAAVEQLSANSITALKAYIAEIVAGSVTTDELYAGIASIALAQLTTANIENANIDWASIGTLSADIAAIAKAHLEDADIEWADIASLTAQVAAIAEAKIAGASITSAQIQDLSATVANIIHAQVSTGEFALAEVENLLANVFSLLQGVAGSMYITNLAVTSANLLNATIDKLVISGEDGKYYQVFVGADGKIATQEVTVTESEIAAGETSTGKQIVAATINAASLNGQMVNAQQGAFNAILTAALTAGQITANDALLASASIPMLYVSAIRSLGDSIDISANRSITLLVGDVSGAQNTAEFSMPYISNVPPETALEAGKMWVDEGVSPSVWRSWRGADVPTAREFAEAFAAEAGAAAFDNALGQYTALSGAARYTIRQTGAGEPYPGGCGVNRIDPAGIVGRQAGTLVARDGDTVTVTSDGSAAYPCAQIAVALKANTTYTLTAQAAVLSGDASVRLRSRVSTDGGQSYPSQTTDASNIITEGTGTLRVTFTTTADTHRQICFFVADDAAAASVRFALIQLEEGADQTAYAPYANVRAFRPRERAEVRACGKNLFDPGSLYASAANMDVSGDSVRIYTTGDGGTWRGARTPVFTIHAGVPYTLSATLDAYVSGNARIGLRGAEDNTFLSGITLVFGSGTGSLSATFTPEADDEVYLSLLCTNTTVLTGDCTFSDIQLEIGGAATAYEPHRAMGGGAVTPDGPLYGLPEAMDSVDISVDGGVSLTRRTKLVTMDGANKSAVASTTPCAAGAYAYVTSATGALQMEDFPALCSHFAAVSKAAPTAQRTAGRMMTGLTSSGVPNIWFFSDQPTVEAFNAWLVEQAAAGTPVQIVHALAAPETEPAAAIAPLEPLAGTVSLATDADALALVRHGSGWATINDTSDVRREVTSASSMLAQLADEIALRVTRGELETFLRLVEEGVYIGKAGSMYRVFIDDSGVHIQQDGVDIATFAKRTLITPYVRAGDPDAPSVLAWTRSAGGGMALVRMEEVV